MVRERSKPSGLIRVARLLGPKLIGALISEVPSTSLSPPNPSPTQIAIVLSSIIAVKSPARYSSE